MLGEVCRAYLLTASDDDNGEIPGLREGWTSGAKCAANACSTSSSSLGEGKLMETHGEISFASQARSVVSMWRPKKIKRRLQSCFDGSCPLHFALGGCMHFLNVRWNGCSSPHADVVPLAHKCPRDFGVRSCSSLLGKAWSEPSAAQRYLQNRRLIRSCFSTSQRFFSFSVFSQTLTTVFYSVAFQPWRLSEVTQYHRFFFQGVMTPSLRFVGPGF